PDHARERAAQPFVVVDDENARPLSSGHGMSVQVLRPLLRSINSSYHFIYSGASRSSNASARAASRPGSRLQERRAPHRGASKRTRANAGAIQRAARDVLSMGVAARSGAKRDAPFAGAHRERPPGAAHDALR